jgi:hypothetical protein
LPKVKKIKLLIKKILKHLGLWEAKPRPPPRMAKAEPLRTEPWIDYSDSQIPPSDDGFYVDSIYPADLLP